MTDLDELSTKVLMHIYKYGPDTPWYMARRLMGESGWAPKYDADQVENVCKSLRTRDTSRPLRVL